MRQLDASRVAWEHSDKCEIESVSVNVNVSVLLFQHLLFQTRCFHLVWLLRTTVPSSYQCNQVSFHCVLQRVVMCQHAMSVLDMATALKACFSGPMWVPVLLHLQARRCIRQSNL